MAARLSLAAICRRLPPSASTSTRAPQVDRLAAEALAQHGGRVDVLVNSAGTYPDAGKIYALEGSVDEWEAALA